MEVSSRNKCRQRTKLLSVPMWLHSEATFDPWCPSRLRFLHLHASRHVFDKSDNISTGSFHGQSSSILMLTVKGSNHQCKTTADLLDLLSYLCSSPKTLTVFPWPSLVLSKLLVDGAKDRLVNGNEAQQQWHGLGAALRWSLSQTFWFMRNFANLVIKV